MLSLSLHVDVRLSCSSHTAFLTPHRLLCGTLIHSPPTTAWPSKCYSIARTSFTAAKSPPEQQQRNPLALCRRQRRRHTRVRRRRGSLFSLAMRTTARHNRLQQKEDGEAVELDVEESPRVRLDGNGKGKGRIENDQDVVGERKSVLGKAGDAAKTAFNAIMAAATLASVALAAETIWELHGTPLTFANAVPILTKLLPLTGIGVFGVVQLVGLVARIVRVVLTLPIMISGIWVILQNVPQVRYFVCLLYKVGVGGEFDTIEENSIIFASIWSCATVTWPSGVDVDAVTSCGAYC